MKDFGKDTVEAIVAAGTVTAKGVEAINAEVLAYSKSAFEDSVAAAKAVLAAKTLKEVVDLQTDFAKTAFEGYLHQSSKLGELTAKITQEAFEPINTRFQAAVEKFVKPLAA
jgi:phasin family protein